MIYLIGGSPRCGKTTLAKKLSKKLSISWISADTIESVVASGVKKKDLNRLFPKNLLRRKTKMSNDLMYNTYSAERIKDVYIRQSKTSWRAIETIVECGIHDGDDYIIEGHQVHPELMNSLVKKHGKKNIQPIVLTRFDINDIVEGGLKHKAKDDWFVQKTEEKSTLYLIAEMLVEYSQYYSLEAKKYKIKTFNLDKSFLQKLNKVFIYLKK